MSATAAPAPAGPEGKLQDLSGVWLKDKAASDSMEGACDAMELGKLMRYAIGLIKGVEIDVTPEEFNLCMLPVTGLGWFKVKEKYLMSGEPAQCSRRDMRKGHHTGTVERDPSTGGILLKIEWGEPCGGSMEEKIYLPTPDGKVLHVDTDMLVGQKPVKYRSVYRCK